MYQRILDCYFEEHNLVSDFVSWTQRMISNLDVRNERPV